MFCTKQSFTKSKITSIVWCINITLIKKSGFVSKDTVERLSNCYRRIQDRENSNRLNMEERSRTIAIYRQASPELETVLR